MSMLYTLLFLLLAICVIAIVYGCVARSKAAIWAGAVFLVLLLLILYTLYRSIGAVLLGGTVGTPL